MNFISVREEQIEQLFYYNEYDSLAKRKMWDSNPRAAERPNGFRNRPLQPSLSNLP